MSKRSHLLPALLFCGTLFSINRALGEEAFIARNNAPQMFGSASAPITALVSSPIQYVITQTDQDTWWDVANKKEILMIDTKCVVNAKEVKSMKTYSLTLRGVGAGGVYTWDVVGTAVDTPGLYNDLFTLSNDRGLGDVLKDEPIVVAQVVTLVARKAVSVTPTPAPTPANPVGN